MSIFENRTALVFDGGMGTMLQAAGLRAGNMPESFNFTAPEVVFDIHSRYIKSGADIISTNTFGANAIKLSGTGLGVAETVKTAVGIAKKAVLESGKKCLVAADFGPTGQLFEPNGELSFERAVEVFSECCAAAEKAGADLIFFETMSDLYECKAALIAAKESSRLPVAVSVTLDESGRTLTGADIDCVCTYLSSLGADAIGINCGLGPDRMEPLALRLAAISPLPVIVNANAGLPRIEGGKTVFDVGADRFYTFAFSLAKGGVSAIGGCCGTTPEHISEVRRAADAVSTVIPEKKPFFAVCSGTRVHKFGCRTAVIGERLNPTGKPRLKKAIIDGDISYICTEASAQTDSGADLLDVNMGLPNIDEKSALSKAVRAVQSVTDLPLVLDSASPDSLEYAARIYDGIPIINSVNGKREVLDSVLPIVKKYGAFVIALLLDENGIPDTAEDRLVIADRILAEAKKYGIDPSRILFDSLTMTVATDARNGDITLECVKSLTDRGLLTVLGVSNISYGLPDRENVNASFLGAAINRGLSAAIINPSSECVKTVLADPSGITEFMLDQKIIASSDGSAEKGELTLKEAVEKGLGGPAAEGARALLAKGLTPLEIINGELIPALTALGEQYEKKQIFLPRLLGGADAAKSAFSVLDEAMKDTDRSGGMPVVLATVKGDIHDIGKNIVSTLLSNYGFDVIDLGKDVPPERVADAVAKSGARLVSLSALMTTTVPAMEETVRLLNKTCPDCKTMVGGAVLTQEYADAMGADFYGPDAIAAVKFACAVRDGK